MKPTTWCACLLFAAICALPGAAEARRGEGESVTITGVVTDGRGAALPQVEVVLEASRRGLDLRRLRRSDRVTQRIATSTNARGEYSLDWTRSSYYNSFALVVQVPVREAGERLITRPLARLDISRRLAGESPIVIALTVEDTTFLESMRQFLAQLETPDQRRAFDLLGRPDEVATVQFADRVETSWWYFRAGKVVRFRDGKFLEETAFDPIQPFF